MDWSTICSRVGVLSCAARDTMVQQPLGMVGGYGSFADGLIQISQRRFGAGGTRSRSLSRPVPDAAATDWLETCWTSDLYRASGRFFGLARLWVVNEFDSLAGVF